MKSNLGNAQEVTSYIAYYYGNAEEKEVIF
jgi:hypothetical protein